MADDEFNEESPSFLEAIAKATAEGTAKAHVEAFKFVDTQLIVSDGWLMRVDIEGNILEKIRCINESSEDL